MLWKRRDSCAPQAASTPYLGVEERKALRSVEHKWEYLAGGKLYVLSITVNKPKNTKNNGKLGKLVSILSFHLGTSFPVLILKLLMYFMEVAKQFQRVPIEPHGLF